MASSDVSTEAERVGCGHGLAVAFSLHSMPFHSVAARIYECHLRGARATARLSTGLIPRPSDGITVQAANGGFSSLIVRLKSTNTPLWSVSSWSVVKWSQAPTFTTSKYPSLTAIWSMLCLYVPVRLHGLTVIFPLAPKSSSVRQVSLLRDSCSLRRAIPFGEQYVPDPSRV